MDIVLKSIVEFENPVAILVIDIMIHHKHSLLEFSLQQEAF